MEGTYQTDGDVRASLSWSTSQVRRRYPVEVTDTGGLPAAGVTVRATRGVEVRSAVSDASGRATLELPFNDNDYALPWSVSAGPGPPATVDFFTATPLRLVAP